MNTKMSSRVGNIGLKMKGASSGSVAFLSRQRVLYAMMIAILVVESYLLILEKSQAPDGLLQGTWVNADEENEIDDPGGTPALEYVYQYPPLSNLDASAGVLFFAHGCSHSALDFWPQYDLTCRNCRGLPIEMNWVMEALSRDYIVIAVSAEDTQSRCWSAERDIPRVTQVIETVRKQIDLPENIPNFLVGASSGGSFVASLGVHMNEQAKDYNKVHLSVPAINIQISYPARKLWKKTFIEDQTMPSIHFVHMERDERTTGTIDNFMGEAAETRNALIVDMEEVNEGSGDEGTDAEDEEENSWFEEYEKQMQKKFGISEISKLEDSTKHDSSLDDSMVIFMRSLAKPHALTPEYLAYRNYKVVPSYRLAHHLIESFKLSGVVDQEGMLIHDPRANGVNWRDTVYKAIPEAITQEKDSLVADESPLCEVLNVAYGQHEITDEFLDQTMNFFEWVSPFNTDEDW